MKHTVKQICTLQSNTIKQIIAVEMEIKQPWWSGWFTWRRAIGWVREEEISRGDFQSSGIFCFMTTKSNSWTFVWISGAVLWSVGGCVCIKILFWTGTELTGLQCNIHGCWSTCLGFNYCEKWSSKLSFAFRKNAKWELEELMEFLSSMCVVQAGKRAQMCRQ